MTNDPRQLFVDRAAKKLNQMKDALEGGLLCIFTDQLVTLWKLAWAFRGDDMKRSFGDHFEEIGRRANRRCLECGDEAQYKEEFCGKCLKEIEEMAEKSGCNRIMEANKLRFLNAVMEQTMSGPEYDPKEYE